MNDIDNEPLKNTIFDILYGTEKSSDEVIEEIIVTVAEDVHETLSKLVNEYRERRYINKIPFITDMNEVLTTKFGSEYREEEDEVNMENK